MQSRPSVECPAIKIKPPADAQLVQTRHHLVLGQRLEVGRLNVDSAGPQRGTRLLRHELRVEVGPDRQF
jgi:hypothetical protein